MIWGSSTRALEKARDEAIVQTYKCRFDECFEEVLTLSADNLVLPKSYGELNNEVDEAEDSPAQRATFQVFIKNQKKKHIVVMGVPGSVDTTEVGIFFTNPTASTVRLEVSSLSSNAKRKVAEMVFAALDKKFEIIQ